MRDLVKPDGTGPAFSPTISYNPKSLYHNSPRRFRTSDVLLAAGSFVTACKSGPAGLGKELWHASEHMKGVNLPPVHPRSGALTPLQQWDLDGGAIRERIEMELRKSTTGKSDATGNQE